MRVLRVFLQVVIVVAGGVSVAVFLASPRRDLVAAAVFFGATAFLLALTFVLGRPADLRPIGIAMVLLSAFGIFAGASYLAGMPMPESGRCRAACSLIRVVTLEYGEWAGRIAGFGLWTSIGAFLALMGYLAARQRPGTFDE